MAQHKAYNGHKNWNHWNVSLWLGNDEGLYNLVIRCTRHHKLNRDIAAGCILSDLQGMGIHATPDGAPYSKTTIRAAIRDWS